MRFAIIAMTLFVLAGCTPTALQITPVPATRKIKEIELERPDGWVRDKIALIDVDGVIMNSAEPGLLAPGEHPVATLLEKLDAARRDSRVRGVVLRINSPGGSVTASHLMHAEINRFRETGRPVVAMMMDVAASGGYYIACACDEIWALPTTVTGSIGVIMQTMEFSGTMDMIGVRTDAITSGPNKDAGSPFRAMKPEERQLFQNIIDDMYGRFVAVVDEGRPELPSARVRELADGRVYTAQQALGSGLIDHLGDPRDAIARVQTMAGIDKSRIVTYQRPGRWHPNIYAAPSTSPVPTAVGAASLWPSWLRPAGAHMMYLWLPGTLE